MAFLFESFEQWKKYSDEKKMSLSDVVLEYEREQKNRTDDQIFAGLGNAWSVDRNSDPLAIGVTLGDDIGTRLGQRADIGLEGCVRPVALILHLEQIAREGDGHVAAGGRAVRDGLHVEEGLVRRNQVWELPVHQAVRSLG